MAAFEHPYVPNASAGPRRRLLDALGIADVEALYAAIPADLRVKGVLDLPAPLPAEQDLRRHVAELIEQNRGAGDLLIFRGAGCWPHHVPALCDEITGRGEFLTAYAGGTYSDHGKNQAVFEFQSLIGALVGLDVVTPPTYDAAGAANSALRAACRVTGRSGIVVPALMNPDRLEQMRGFVRPTAQPRAVRQDPATGQLDLADLEAKLGPDVGAVFLEQPGFLGTIETQGAAIAERVHAAGAMLVVGVDPLSLGVLAAPSDWGADFVTGDIQPLGIHMHAGGGCAGFIATRDEARLVAELPTTLISAAPAEGGGVGFAWSTPERTSYDTRHEATDYYGTTQWLWGIGAAVYLSLLGPKGLAELGEVIMQRSLYAARAVARVPGVRVPHLDRPFFKEFVVTFDKPGATVTAINRALLAHGIVGGHDVSRLWSGGPAMLMCVTETHDRAAIDRLAAALAEVLS
ncbi:MAG: aminomethyl-transferring glycine dehydrogenase subunit GcvPA [Alphaproteobacteria bacterium]|nr:aminomethyl-transferring glycine dehydrogenase subunit GcvPA [Alphaproteobacteria bacterium]